MKNISINIQMKSLYDREVFERAAFSFLLATKFNDIINNPFFSEIKDKFFKLFYRRTRKRFA